ncbi:spore cortex biosynthesis protein YabQ [Anoxybacillus voinovskiensis]|uniref:Spore cortex biosynthesis protein YabQ n=1 Tax=Anoxybacteroides voinovskiense TaxID=230470 RepID=A0A840DZU2_9BACL|nr:spore cortex biosynthesis protein YabQ [Anoxybacillus voinovskiensis]MBB4075009.1 spore cortex biosynthesis protein YabQ [Anoxybacillus voinovskiensis]GGJ75665.1 spore cortex biosynthesis protein YabQ [Anoxybacillus voinovskiensis]
MSLTTQLETMLAMIGMGGWLGIALDTYNRFLKRSKRSRFIVFFHDLFFWMLQALFIFYVLLLTNDGELRVYIFLALLCGYAAYQSLFRHMYLKLLETMIRCCIALYRFFLRTCYYVIVQPLRLLLQLFLWTALLIWRVVLFFIRILFRCIVFFLLPFRALGKWLWSMIPWKWREPVEKFLRVLAGFIQKAKNRMLRWSIKWRK